MNKYSMTPLPKDDPALHAWEKYKETPEYQNSWNWAGNEKHRDGSMWAAFYQGWELSLSEIVNRTPPLSRWQRWARDLRRWFRDLVDKVKP